MNLLSSVDDVALGIPGIAEQRRFTIIGSARIFEQVLLSAHIADQDCQESIGMKCGQCRLYRQPMMKSAT